MNNSSNPQVVFPVSTKEYYNGFYILLKIFWFLVGMGIGGLFYLYLYANNPVLQNTNPIMLTLTGIGISVMSGMFTMIFTKILNIIILILVVGTILYGTFATLLQLNH